MLTYPPSTLKVQSTIEGNEVAKLKIYDLTKTLLSLLSALLSAAVLFLASRSGARSRGNLDAVFGLRLPDRDELWLSLSVPLVLRSEVSVGRGRDAGLLVESVAF
jgi:hypothetical protein